MNMFTLCRLLTRWFFVLLLLGTADAAPTLSKQVISNKDTLEVTCDAMSFDNIPREVKSLLLLDIQRKTIFDDEFKTVASYPTIKGESSEHYIPAGRDWATVMTGGIAKSRWQGNIESISVRLTVRDACCSDAGQYRCTAMTAGDNETYATTIADVTCTEDKLLRLLDTQNDISIEGKHEVLCTAAGQLKMNVSWLQKRSADEIIIPPDDERVETVGPVPSHDCSGCLENLFMTRLSMWTHEFDRGSSYYCVVSNGDQELNRSLVMLPLETTDLPSDTTNAQDNGRDTTQA